MDQNEVLIFHGPHFAGKSTFYKKELKMTYKAIWPSKIFKANPSLGFRDIGLDIVRNLKEGKRLAIIDPNEYKKTRLSYISLLQKKCPNVSVAVISILPKYGCEQLFWTRELRLAAESCKGVTDDCSVSEIPVNDAQINKWFSQESDCEIHYRHAIVEKPSETEGKVIEKIVGIYTISDYKWEVISGLTSSKQRLSKLAKSFELWSNINHCGRIIVICDGSQIYTGEKTKAQQQRDIDDALRSLTNLFTQCPVYVFHLDDPKQAGGYVIPPKPGILAFLQQRHHLNLHSKRSFYIYETSNHMKMAENAGVRHIKASRVLDHPSLVMSSHAAATPTIPEMLQTKKILPGASEPPSIPLAGRLHTFSEGKIQQTLPYGRSEYIYATDDQSILRYNDLYMKHCTQVGVPGSKMSPKKKCHTTPDKSGTSQVQLSDQSKLSIASRDLPKWMIKKDRSHESRSSEEVISSSNEGLADRMIRKTLYVMTEKELLEVACDVLKQAGKDEIVKQFMSKNNQESESDIIESKQRNINSSAPKSNPPSGVSHHRKTKFRTEETKFTDVGEHHRSFCPKVEQESDIKDRCAASPIDIDNLSDDETEKQEKLQSKERSDKTKACVDDFVADILDELAASNVEPKPSPKKRTRHKAEPVFSTCTPPKQRCLDKNVPDCYVRERETSVEGDSKVHSDQNSAGHSKVNSDHEVNVGRKRARHTPDLSCLDDIF